MAATDRYRYYVSAYTMRAKTEGVPLALVRYPFLHRSMPPQLESQEDYDRAYAPQSNSENLLLTFHPRSYKIGYESGTEEWFVHSRAVRAMGVGAMEERKEERRAGWEKRFGGTEGELAVGRWGRDGVGEMEGRWMEMVRDKRAEGEGERGDVDVEVEDTKGKDSTETATEKGDEVMGGV